METVLLVAIIVVVVTGVAVFIYREWRKEVIAKDKKLLFRLPDDARPGDPCVHVFAVPGVPEWVLDRELPAEIVELMVLVTTVTDCPIRESFDVTFESARRKCGRKWANGCYTQMKTPDRPAHIWVSTGHDDFRPKSLLETAFLHELLHHATKLTDKNDSEQMARLERAVRKALAMDTETFEVTQVIQETPRAILVQLATGDEHWIPKSVIDDESEVFDSDHQEGDLIVAAWFAEKEGLE